ncbi:amidohydrolase family protein [Flavobacterium sp. CLA17]|uniref:amidohydrolase family protein n=1 Tax=Flavobacterium sp. CLA17 TaxID=2724135 RepID=UPI001492CB16|nr:amidohydrolase family protein [Flavobacterium sp. CLA17]QSB29289.1 amidohydrolase family protein [Flavobacterium sp. CLA17]
MEKNKIVNCHAHVFTGDHVPSYLAKTFLPWPLYYLLPLSPLVKLFRFWYDGPYKLQFQPFFKKCRRNLYHVKIFIIRSAILSTLRTIVGLWLTVSVFYIIFYSLEDPRAQERNWISTLYKILEKLIIIPDSLLGKVFIVLCLIAFYKPGRNFLLFLFSKIWSFLGVFTGSESKKLAKRYLNLVRFALYDKQFKIFGRLKGQYPKGTGFILLPMDMEYMEAGGLKKGNQYSDQMAQLAVIKENNKDIAFPFVFAEPRRIRAEGISHFDFDIIEEKVVLKECFIKEYIENYGFSGFKIYPALGYYPFDETLLPLWKYAADAGLPILTHCIRGTIFYRGTKKKEWDYHPLFVESIEEDVYKSMLLPGIKNSDFINNFTHPLNYLCLLDSNLLKRLVVKAKDDRIRAIFGYDKESDILKYDLSHLKLCFGHYGGDDEWLKYLESDRYDHSNQLAKHPSTGIIFTETVDGKPADGKIEQLWKHADWYSIISSIMLQYDNVYADLSYIIHSEQIQPLLKQTLLNEDLRKKILFGTDFYVVRNHRSEKDMLAGILKNLTEEDFDQIARINPELFLKNNI